MLSFSPSPPFNPSLQENFGLDLIEVRDDGSGIKKEDRLFLALPHYTSKLSSFEDLASLASYGFRGEGLASIAAVSELRVTTRTEADNIAQMCIIDHSGKTVATKPSHLGCGTTISAANLFKNFPVRRQYFRNVKQCRESLKKVEDVMMAFGIAHHNVRFTLKHNKSILWQKNLAVDFRTNLSMILGVGVMEQLFPLVFEHFDPMLKIRGYVPKPGGNGSLVSRATNDRIFLFVNSRPVIIKPLMQVIDSNMNTSNQMCGWILMVAFSMLVSSCVLCVCVVSCDCNAISCGGFRR